MADNAPEKGGHSHVDDDAEASHRHGGGLQAGGGTPAAGADPPPAVDSDAAPPGEGEDDLYFRQEILKSLRQATDPSIQLALIELMDKEGEREVRVAMDEVRAGESVQKEELANLRRGLIAQNQELARTSRRVTTTTVAPVLFAILVFSALCWFWAAGQKEAAEVSEKILVMVITGGLGWAAGRHTGNGGADPHSR